MARLPGPRTPWALVRNGIGMLIDPFGEIERLHGRYGAVPALFDLGESLRQPQETAAAANGRRKPRQDNAETTH